MEQKPRSYPVSNYLKAIKKRLNTEIPQVWVHGVITQVQVKDKIAYVSIAEFKEGDVKPVATVSLFMWRGDFDRMSFRLRSLDRPFELKPELKINVLLAADIYEVSGKFQCYILDIDPAYTIGELALTREAILKRLRKEGLLHKNGSLPMPLAPLHVGLITGENTAAFHDFTNKLRESGFAFKISAAFAKMQGNETEPTILAALGRLAQNSDIDVVCIVRGGGSKTDLNYFDSEALCRAVANYQVPVLTGIGHEIDNSLLDNVAWQHCITPTDCAKFLVDRLAEAWQQVLDISQEIAGRVRSEIPREQERMQRLREGVRRAASKILDCEANQIALMARSLSSAPGRILKAEAELLLRNGTGLRNGSRKLLELAKGKFLLVEARLKAADPATILSKGYTLTLDSEGRAIRSAAKVTSGQTLTTKFCDGEVTSVAK